MRYVMEALLVALAFVSLLWNQSSPAAGIDGDAVSVTVLADRVEFRFPGGSGLSYRVKNAWLSSLERGVPPVPLFLGSPGLPRWKGPDETSVFPLSAVPRGMLNDSWRYKIEIQFAVRDDRRSVTRWYIALATARVRVDDGRPVALESLSPPGGEPLVAVEGHLPSRDPHASVLLEESRIAKSASFLEGAGIRIHASLLYPEFSQEAIADLRTLTDDELVFDADGVSVRIARRAHPPFSRPWGTALVRRLVEDPLNRGFGVDISFEDQYRVAFALILDSRGASDGTGSSVSVRYDPFADDHPALCESASGDLVLWRSPSYLNLAHELVHALHALEGVFDPSLQTEMVGVWFGPKRQLAYVDVYLAEERKTVGMGKHWRDGPGGYRDALARWPHEAAVLPDVTAPSSMPNENLIRVEHGFPPRLDY